MAQQETESLPSPSNIDDEQAAAMKKLQQLKNDMQRAIDAKNEGNEHFKEKDYKKAIAKYHHALLIARGIQNSSTNALVELLGGVGNSIISENDRAIVDDIILKCYNNLAACIIARDSATDDDFSRAIQHCEKVLAIEAAPKEQKEKALYRKGIALTRMRDYDAAMKCFQACSNKNTEAQERLRHCREMVAADRRRRDEEIRANFARAEARRNAQAHQNAANVLQNGGNNDAAHAGMNGIVMNGDVHASEEN